AGDHRDPDLHPHDSPDVPADRTAPFIHLKTGSKPEDFTFSEKSSQSARFSQPGVSSGRFS
ncbi:MAG: hypothetical protein SH850_07280, partial [Planctomycetaceae bacterium]|nr:hypothetical protein [Planctomycetaceae bacterium]